MPKDSCFRLVFLLAGLRPSLQIRTPPNCYFSLFAFQLFLRLSRKPPFAPREVSRCRLLSLLQCSGSASVICFVLLLSVLLRLSCALTRRHFVSLEHFLPGSAGSFTIHRCCLILSLFVCRCCVVPAAHSLRLLLTTKMASMHVHFPSSRYFIAFICVFYVILCVSVPCEKPLCGWSGLPCGWGTLPCGWGYSYCGRGNSPRSGSDLPYGKGHPQLCTSDLKSTVPPFTRAARSGLDPDYGVHTGRLIRVRSGCHW